MLQQPLARRVAGAARCAAAGEALPGALPLSSMRRRARGPASSRSNRWNDGCLDDGGASGAGRKRSGLPGEALEVEESGSGHRSTGHKPDLHSRGCRIIFANIRLRSFSNVN